MFDIQMYVICNSRTTKSSISQSKTSFSKISCTSCTIPRRWKTFSRMDPRMAYFNISRRSGKVCRDPSSQPEKATLVRQRMRSDTPPQNASLGPRTHLEYTTQSINIYPQNYGRKQRSNRARYRRIHPTVLLPRQIATRATCPYLRILDPLRQPPHPLR